MQKIRIWVGKAAAAAAWLYIMVIAGVMPFYFTQGYGYIGSDKAHLFQKVGAPLIEVAFLLTCLYGILAATKERRRMSVTDWFVLFYLAAVVLSYLCSDFRQQALWGNATWPMGFLTQISMVASYFVFSRVFTGEKQFFDLIILASTVVFGLGVLNRFGVYPISMEYANPSFISTIGNINWFCGYWAVVVWIVVIKYWNREVHQEIGKKMHGSRKRKFREVFYSACMLVPVVIGLATGIMQGSDSGLLAMAVGFLVLFCLSVENGDRMQRFWELVLLLCLVCIVGFVVNKLFPEALTYEGPLILLCIDSALPWIGGAVSLGVCLLLKRQNHKGIFAKRFWVKCRYILPIVIVSALGMYLIATLINTLLPGGVGALNGQELFTFDKNWGSDRGGTWYAGMRVWWGQDLLHKLTGAGPDCMYAYLYGNNDPILLEAVKEQFVNSRLLNAHGEWITHLANLGILGLISFAGIIVSFLYRSFKEGKSRPLMYVFAFCVLGYTVNNIFSFQTMMNITMLFLLLGVGENRMRSK